VSRLQTAMKSKEIEEDEGDDEMIGPYTIYRIP
jgi:hypothetical protein